MDNAFPLHRGMSSGLPSVLLSSAPVVAAGEFVSIRFHGCQLADVYHIHAGSLG